MSEYPTQYGSRHQSSPGFGRSQISRQFTEAESALDERMTAHLTAPPIQMHIGSDIGQSYKWLSEDLKLRSTLSSQLAQEQSMAYQQSARHELANQALQQEERDAEALDGIAYANDLLASGKAKDAKDAIYQSTLRNPRLGLNPMASKVFGDLERTYETPEQRELRQLKMDYDVVSLGNSKFEADDQAKYNSQLDEEERARRIAQKIQLEGRTTANDAIYQETRGYAVRAAHRQAKEAADLFNAIGDPANETAQIQIQGMLTDLGLGDVDIDGPGRGVLGGEITRNVVFDPIGRAEILDTPEKQQAYAEALKMTLSSEPGTAEYKEGKKVIDSISYQWIKRNGEKLQEVKANAVRDEISKDFNTSWGTIDKEIRDIRMADSQKIKNADKPAMMLNTHARRFDKKLSEGGDDIVAKHLEEVGKMLAALDSEEPPTIAEVDEFITTSSLTFAQEFKEAKVQNALGNTKKIAKAIDGVEISTKDEWEALAPGTPFTWQGKPGVK